MGRIWMPGGGGGADLDVITAGAGDVLSGKVIVDQDGNPITGTIPVKNAIASSINCGGSVDIPAGYYPTAGKVQANSLASQTAANAGAGQILSGYSGWVNGAKVNGSMTNRGAWTGSVGTNGTTYIPAGYHNGSGYINNSQATMDGGTYTASSSQQVIYCRGKYMKDNIILNAVSRSGCLSGNITSSTSQRAFVNTDGSTVYFYYLQIRTGFTPIAFGASAYKEPYTSIVFTQSAGSIRFVSYPYDRVFRYSQQFSTSATGISFNSSYLIVPVELPGWTYSYVIAGVY